MIPEDWEKQAAEHQKAYKRLLEKGNKNKILQALPDLHEEAFAKIDCLQCANCCKNYSPRFKQPDIKRISKHLRMKEGDFAASFLKLDTDGDYVANSTPCPFLEEGNQCSVYDVRPADCRNYPYTNQDVMIKRVPLTLKNSTVCPAAFTVLEQLLQQMG
jgi:uncharacterized protein